MLQDFGFPFPGLRPYLGVTTRDFQIVRKSFFLFFESESTKRNSRSRILTTNNNGMTSPPTKQVNSKRVPTNQNLKNHFRFHPKAWRPCTTQPTTTQCGTTAKTRRQRRQLLPFLIPHNILSQHRRTRISLPTHQAIPP